MTARKTLTACAKTACNAARSARFPPGVAATEIRTNLARSTKLAHFSTDSRHHMTPFSPPTGESAGVPDWTANAVQQIPSRSLNTPDDPLRILVLYGSLRTVSYSNLLAREFARLLAFLGADVRLFDPTGLPLKDETSTDHPKVQELRDLAIWSEGMVWVSPEQHGSMTAVFKNQIDWIPLSLGSVRPTQGRTLALAQVNGGSQSFNCLNQLRILGRWMRCFTIPNQSSIPKAWTQFDSDGRLKDTGFRERVVDVAEELWKVTYLMRPVRASLDDRYSERKETAEKGRLQSQAEKEAERVKLEAEAEAAARSRVQGGSPSRTGKETNAMELNEPDVGGDKLAPSRK